MTATQKRPLGLKGRKQQQQQQENEDREKKKARLTGEDSSFTTVALASSSTNQTGQTADGLTLEDLVQLKNQADELIDNPTGLEEDDDQLVNLLRGICHEAIRQIEINEKKEEKETKEEKQEDKLEEKEKEEKQEQTGKTSSYLINNLSHQLLGWASLELGIFLTLHQNPHRFAQEDEPKTLEAWLSIASKVLDNLPSQTPQENSGMPSDLQLLPSSLSLLKTGKPSDIAQILLDFELQSWNREQSTYLLRTIDRIILLKSEIISQDPTPIFKIIIKLLEGILSKNDAEGADAKSFQRLLDQRLGDCHLAHGSLLAEKLEAKYYPEQDEEETNEEEEEEFAIDIQDPTYILALENLKLADSIFSKLLEDIDENNEPKDELKSKLDETLLTLGNLLPPGSEREELYIRAGLSSDKEDDNGNDEK